MKSLFILAFLFLFQTFAFSQGKDNSLEGVPAKERIIFGGGFGLGFGSNQDFVSVSPIIGYAITKKLVVGSGIGYQYINYKNIYQGKSVNVNNFSINPFARFSVYQGFFVQTEYEYLNYEGILVPSLETKRLNYSSFLAGGGLLQPIGDKASFFIMALYNFSYRSPRSGEFLPYDSPWVIRAGINIGSFVF